jgi:hypothetical protein
LQASLGPWCFFLCDFFLLKWKYADSF